MEAIASWLHRPRLSSRIAAGLFLGLASLILYSLTMAPDIGANDVAEWQAVAFRLGVAHAPGSPAYTILGHLFSLFPIGIPAARVTFVSVVVGAAGVVAIYSFVLILFDRLLPALVSAATLALAGVWWAHATVATPYNAIPTIMAVLLLLLLLWSRSGNVKLLWGGALLAGIGVAYHPLVMFFLPVAIAGIFILGPWKSLLKPRPFLILAAFFIAGISLYLYLPVRAGEQSAIVYQKIDSLSTFIDFVSASHARDTKLRVSVFPGFEEISDRVDEVVYVSYQPFFFIVIFAPAALLAYPGTWKRLRPQGRWLVFLLVGGVAQLFVTFIFSDVYAHYYLAMLFYFAVWAGLSIYLVEIGISFVIRANPWNQLTGMFAGIFFLAILAMGVPQNWDFANHADDLTMRNYVNFVYTKATPGSVVMASWESYTGLMYAQQVEGRRLDIILQSVASEDLQTVMAKDKSTRPSSSILVSASYNIKDKSDPMVRDPMMYGGKHPLSIKALTYQDFDHGPPYPVATRLFELYPSVINY